MTASHILAILALIFAVFSVVPIPNLRAYWLLAIAVILLSIAMFIG